MPVLSNLKIAKLQPGQEDQQVTVDSLGRGLGTLILRIRPNGTKAFYLRYTHNGARRLELIGHFDDAKGARSWHLDCKGGPLTLAAAREGAMDLAKLALAHGELGAYFERVVEEKQKREEEARRLRDLEQRQGSFAQLLEVYVEQLERSGKASATGVKLALRRHVLDPFPELAKQKAHRIEPGHIRDILSRLVQAGHTRQVNKVRSFLHAAFTQAAKLEHDPRRSFEAEVVFCHTTNPVALVPRIAEFDKAGDRVLDSTELRRFWEALEHVNPVCRAFIRFNLALGGQRIEQLLRVDWTDFDFEASTVSLRDSKGRPTSGAPRDHLLPMTPFALTHLDPLRDLNAASVMPFTCDGVKRLRADTVSHAVTEISRQLTEVEGVPPFRAGDLRRTTETLLASIGINRETRAHLLSHGRSGVQAKHYDRYEYLPEKRRALERWERQLMHILHGRAGCKVVRIR